jgi:hypothetical protein
MELINRAMPVTTAQQYLTLTRKMLIRMALEMLVMMIWIMMVWIT